MLIYFSLCDLLVIPVIAPSIFNLDHAAQAARVLFWSLTFIPKEELPALHTKHVVPNSSHQETNFSGSGKFVRF